MEVQESWIHRCIMRLTDGLSRWSRARQRKTDLAILWPSCKARSRGDLKRAKAAFALHVMSDYAWYADYTDDELAELIRGLE
jgi:hypothetical protein